MASNLLGVELGLERFEEPVRAALSTYSEISGRRVQFDIDQAAILKPTPNRPYSAKSISEVRYAGEMATQLVVLAFAPFDATGQESTTYRMAAIEGIYSGDQKFIPRPKTNIEAETHLTIASAPTRRPEREPVMFAGNLSLIDFCNNGKLSERNTLGQTTIPFLRSMEQIEPAEPAATYTVGSRVTSGSVEQRFGDPHAVYNPWEHQIQVCGFIAVSSESPQHEAALKALNSVKPLIASD